MNGAPGNGKKNDEKFRREIGKKEERRLKGREERDRSVWFGFGMFGLIGWAVAVPTLIGIAIGVWLDAKFKSQISWTLTFLLIGVAVGCYNAWRWLNREGRGE
jgi:ATP synthase protein I